MRHLGCWLKGKKLLKSRGAGAAATVETKARAELIRMNFMVATVGCV